MKFSPKVDVSHSCEFGLIAPDKSLSHRSVIFSFLTKGQSRIQCFLDSKDTFASKRIAQILGAKIEGNRDELLITPPDELPKTANLQCLNSGTSMRLYAGLLSGCEGRFGFDGDESLRRRPMQRIRDPLEQMGAKFSASRAPFVLQGCASLQGIAYESPIASAQVKGAFILSALNASSLSFYRESALSRDHTERFLSSLGASIIPKDGGLEITPLSCPLPCYEIEIANDPSSVIFFIVACLIAPQKMDLKISKVLLNPTRIYALEVLIQMGAKLSYKVEQSGIEPIGEVEVSSSELRGIEVREHIAWLIDEIPALSIAFACAKGKSKVAGAEELRLKESDRISSVVSNLHRLGIEAVEFRDGFEVIGGEFKRAKLQSCGDHRIAMSFALAGIRTEIEMNEVECIGVSFENFLKYFDLFVDIKE